MVTFLIIFPWIGSLITSKFGFLLIVFLLYSILLHFFVLLFLNLTVGPQNGNDEVCFHLWNRISCLSTHNLLSTFKILLNFYKNLEFSINYYLLNWNLEILATYVPSLKTVILVKFDNIKLITWLLNVSSSSFLLYTLSSFPLLCKVI